jgi:hypothetical protein
MKTIKTFIQTNFKMLITILIVLIILFFSTILIKDWLVPKVIKGLGGFTKSEVKSTKDTLSIKYNDIYIKYKKLETKVNVIPPPEYVPVYRYVVKQDPNKPSITGKITEKIVEIKGVNRYMTVINDTILQGNIETIISIDSCKLISQSLKYEPKIPYIREKIITIVETKETILSQEPKAYIGGGLDVNSFNQITPNLIYMTKKKLIYKGGYIKSLDNKTSNGFTIGIAKVF